MIFIILYAILILLYFKYSPTIDINKNIKGSYNVLLWYTFWDKEKDSFTRKYILLYSKH